GFGGVARARGSPQFQFFRFRPRAAGHWRRGPGRRFRKLLWRTGWRRRPGAQCVREFSRGQGRAEGRRCDHQHGRRENPQCRRASRKTDDEERREAGEAGLAAQPERVVIDCRASRSRAEAAAPHFGADKHISKKDLSDWARLAWIAGRALFFGEALAEELLAGGDLLPNEGVLSRGDHTCAASVAVAARHPRTRSGGPQPPPPNLPR